MGPSTTFNSEWVLPRIPGKITWLSLLGGNATLFSCILQLYSMRPGATADANIEDVALPVVNISSDRTWAIVGHFRPMQEYEARMTVFNSRGFEGPFSETIRFSMPEGRK